MSKRIQILALVKPEASPMRDALMRCRRHVAAALGFSALVNLLYIAPTLYMLQVYDRVVPTQGVQTLIFLTGILVFALGCLCLLDRIRSRLLIRAGVVLNAALAPAVLDARIGRPSLPFSNSAMRELDAMRSALSGPAVLAIVDAPWTPIYIGLCFLLHPWIGVIALVGGLTLAGLAWRNERATSAGYDLAQDAASQTYASQDALLAAAESVRGLGMRPALVARQLRKRRIMLKIQTQNNFHAGSYFAGTKFVRLLLQSLALGVGAWLAVDNMISGGAIFASSFLIARALAPVEMLIGGWKQLAQARASYHKLDQLLSVASGARVPTELPSPRGALSLEGVTVLNSMRDGTVLNGVSFTVNPGEVVAIVGPSGSGKSTLMRAIVGATPVDRGAIRFDAAEINDWDNIRIARYIGYLPQDSALFEGTVKENIARFDNELGRSQSDVDADAVAAAELVGARELISRMSSGFDHRLGVGGRGLSAGQTQRIALARAAYGDPTYYVLDEPNAHLDTEGDAALNAAITTLKASGKTILVVSHKFGILSAVDKILVLRDGKVDLFGARDNVLDKITHPRIPRAGQVTNGGSGV